MGQVNPLSTPKKRAVLCLIYLRRDWIAARWDQVAGGVKYLENLGYDVWFPNEIRGIVAGDLFEEIIHRLINERFCLFSKLQNMGVATIHDANPLFASHIVPSAKGRRHAQTILHQDEEFMKRFGVNPEYEPGSFFGRTINQAAIVAIFKSIVGA
jgi:hypothetical protein